MVPTPPADEVEPLVADELARTGAALLLDVREPEEFAAGHVPGSLHVPLAQLPGAAAELPDSTIVCVCRSGARSAVAAAALAGAGRDARNLAGGLLAWAAEGLPLARADGGSGSVL